MPLYVRAGSGAFSSSFLLFDLFKTTCLWWRERSSEEIEEKSNFGIYLLCLACLSLSPSHSTCCCFSICFFALKKHGKSWIFVCLVIQWIFRYSNKTVRCFAKLSPGSLPGFPQPHSWGVGQLDISTINNDFFYIPPPHLLLVILISRSREITSVIALRSLCIVFAQNLSRSNT